MTSTPPGSRRPSSSKGTPPMPARRSARQERIAARQAGRGLDRAGTQQGSGPSTFMLVTIVAVVLGVALLGGAALLNLNQNPTPAGLVGSPQPPAAVLTTPTDIPWNGTTLGKPDAKVTLDLWSDFQCPNCATFQREYETKLVDKYVRTGEVKLVYHDLIVIDSGGGHESRDAANAGLCAADQNKFWLMHDWLFANQGPEKPGGSGAFTIDRLVAMGQGAGFDMTKFEPCVRNGQHLADIQAEKPPAELAARPQTPTFYVNGQLVNITTSYSDIDASLDKALGKASPSASPSAS